MRRRLFAFCACAAVVAAATPVAATDARDGMRAYATALRSFAPALSDAEAAWYASRVVDEADRAGIDARLVVALIAVESSWDPAARSRAGAVGLGQLMPATAADLGVDPRDPGDNLRGAVTYVRALLAHYADRPLRERFVAAIAAYNAGPGAVDRAGGVPPSAQTERYVRRVIALWRRLVTG